MLVLRALHAREVSPYTVRGPYEKAKQNKQTPALETASSSTSRVFVLFPATAIYSTMLFEWLAEETKHTHMENENQFVISHIDVIGHPKPCTLASTTSLTTEVQQYPEKYHF
jgi:hypothetical protein